MQVDNPGRILLALDKKLDHKVELTLIGKSALWLGYDDAPNHFGVTLDVDSVVPERESAAFHLDLQFWDSLTSANAELATHGLYLTHIFEEWQIILRGNWMDHRVVLHRPAGLCHIRLLRPATLDLILTKMMRGADPQHLEEVAWMMQHDRITRADLLAAFQAARVPEDQEILALFETAKPLVLARAYVS